TQAKPRRSAALAARHCGHGARRLPWTGGQALRALSRARSFGEGTLRRLGAAQVGAPAAVAGDVLGRVEGVPLADKTFDPAAVHELDVADRQRWGHQSDEAAELAEGDRPNFDLDGGSRRAAHEPRLRGLCPGQGVQGIAGRGGRLVEETRSSLGELMMEGESAQVRADDREGNRRLGAGLRRDGGTRTRAFESRGAGSRGLAELAAETRLPSASDLGES